MARYLAVGSGVDSVSYSRGAGKGSPHHRPVGRRLWRGRATGLDFRAVGAPPLSEAQQASLGGAPVKEPPARSGIELANWNWKVVRRFVLERFGISLSRSGCLNYLHRLGFVLKRLVKFDEPSCPGTNGDAMHTRLKQPHSTGDDKSTRDVGEPERR